MQDQPLAHDDDVADAIAMVAAARANDGEALAVLVQNANLFGATIALVKLLAELADECNLCTVHFREWAAAAAQRHGRSTP